MTGTISLTTARPPPAAAPPSRRPSLNQDRSPGVCARRTAGRTAGSGGDRHKRAEEAAQAARGSAGRPPGRGLAGAWAMTVVGPLPRPGAPPLRRPLVVWAVTAPAGRSPSCAPAGSTFPRHEAGSRPPGCLCVNSLCGVGSSRNRSTGSNVGGAAGDCEATDTHRKIRRRSGANAQLRPKPWAASSLKSRSLFHATETVPGLAAHPKRRTLSLSKVAPSPVPKSPSVP